jgi:SHQ1 protein
MALDPFWCIQWDVWRSNGRDNRTAKINITETQREINCDNNGISDTMNRFQDGSSSSVSEPSERTSNGDKNIIDNKSILKTEVVLVPGVCESNTNFIQKENSITQNLSKEDSFNITGGFSEKERTCLSSGSLRNKEYLIEEGSLEERSVLLGLADILFSFCFDYRYVK